jgi:outer membrane protein assembly factor BamB
VVAHGNPPVRWSESENIKWKTALPGEGQSTPIIWGNKIFLLTAVPIGIDTGEVKSAFGGPPSKKVNVPYEYVVLCLERKTGSILWQQTVREEQPHEGFHPTGSLAPASPVTDGNYLWASFGSRGLYCLDFDGNVIWEAKTTKMQKAGRYGEGSSPVLTKNAVVVLSDHKGQSVITAFDKNSGSIVWQRERDEQSSWSTPIVTEVDDRWEVITSAPNAIRSYDAETGDLVWHCEGLTDCAAPSPVVHNGKVYCTTGFRGQAILAIELGHRGDLTGTDSVIWSRKRGASNVPTPLIHEGRFYIFEGYRAVLSCIDADTGEPYFERERLRGLGAIYASPLAVDDRIYICDRDGNTVVLNSSEALNVLASNQLDETFDASPVVLGDELYLRGRKHIYCVANENGS